MPPLKSVFRILTWTHGSFDLASLDDRPMPGEISASVQELLMEGLRQIDELNAIRDRLPDLGAHLFLPRPITPKLSKLSPLELEVFQLAYNHEQLATILEREPGDGPGDGEGGAPPARGRLPRPDGLAARRREIRA